MSMIHECRDDMDNHEKATWQEERDSIESDAQPVPFFMKRKTYTPKLRELK